MPTDSEVSKAPAKSSSMLWKSGLNIIILGAAGVAIYYAYEKVASSSLFKNDTAPAKDKKKSDAATGSSVIPPDLQGPPVRNGMIASTRSNVCVNLRDPRFVYDQIFSYDPQGYATFKATTNGNFTRRLYCAGGRKWAEINPL